MADSKLKMHFDQLIWAVDPYCEANSQAPVIQLLKTLRRKTNCKIEPVYVVSPSAPSLIREFNDLPFFLSKAEKDLGAMLKRRKVTGFSKPKILVEKSSFLRKSVRTFLEYAEKQNADAIVVASRASKGAARFFLGSFAETLVLKSRIPVIVVNPKAPKIMDIKSILFPADFTKASWESFNKVVDLARLFKSKITVYHFYQGDPSDISAEKLKAKIETRISYAKKHGVKCDGVVQAGVHNVGDCIVKIAKARNKSLIAMAGHTGEFASTIVGSTARRVIRRAHCPVWLLHTPD